MNRFIYILTYGAEIKAASGNLKCIYDTLKIEMGIFGELNILSYSQINRYMKDRSYHYIYTNSGVPYKITKVVPKISMNFKLSKNRKRK